MKHRISLPRQNTFRFPLDKTDDRPVILADHDVNRVQTHLWSLERSCVESSYNIQPIRILEPSAPHSSPAISSLSSPLLPCLALLPSWPPARGSRRVSLPAVVVIHVPSSSLNTSLGSYSSRRLSVFRSISLRNK
jgi:hypothetical protein